MSINNNDVKEKKPRLNIRKLFANNKFVFVFSLFVAFFIWLWVSVEKSPVTENVIVAVPVQLDVENSVPAQLGLQVFGNTKYTVDVTVSGKKFIVSSLDADDIKVVAQTNYVDSAGNKTLTLKASAGNGKDFEITALSQNYISVYFDTYKETEFALTPNIISANSSIVTDGCILGNVVFSKSTVTVSGPTSEVNKISGISATTTINDVLTATTTVTPTIELVGASTSELSNVTVNTGDTAITMTLPVLKEVVLPTTITLKNAPASYLAGSLNKTIYPSTVKVGVPIESIDTVTEISIGTIDFSDLDAGNNTFNFKPEDISAYLITDNVKNFKVTVNMANVVSKTVSVPAANITITTQKPRYTSTVTSPIIQNVKIVGPASVVDTITGSNVYANIDLTSADLAEGIMTVPVKIVVGDNTTCWANGNYSATVTAVLS